MKRSVMGWVVLGLLVGGIGPMRADETDIFSAPTVQPNVIILIDSSGSMDDPVAGEDKIVSARNAAIDLVTNTSGMRFGILRFNLTSTGARMVAVAGSTVTDLVDGINDIDADGYTPLGRATGDVQDYLQGTFSEGTYSGSTNGGRRGYRDTDECGRNRDSNCRTTTATVTYPSPIQYECQKNFVIIITDGLPNGEDENLVVDMARELYENDHSSTLTGVQNATVYTVGFNVPEGTALLTAAAAAGHGQFFTADDAAELSQALRNILSDIAFRTYTFNAPLIPSTGTSGAGKAYLCSFDPDPAKPFWNGYVKAFTTNSAGMISVDANGIPLTSSLAWEAGALLAAKTPASRTIFTYFSGAQQDVATTNASITTAMLGLTTSTDRTKLIDFVRGVDTYDEDLDGDTTEARSWKMGDPFHSAPALVIPPPGLSTDSTYLAFKTAQASRTKVLLVGANDGMLHAFRESDGQELWAYVPSDELGSLKLLRPSSVAHAYFVDGTPVITDVKIGSTWKTIAVFGERKGGRYYHALDITDPTNPSFLWSFTDARLGETWSEPSIGTVKMSDSSVRYVAFVGGGYNSTNNNATGKAVMAIDLTNGAKLWEYYNTGTADAQYMNFSIPASVAALDLDNNGFTDRLYVADVGGQIWKFDVSPLASLTSGLVNNWTGKRLFAAASTQSNPPPAGAYTPAQGMYARPTLAYDDTGALWLYIGSGDRNNPNANSSNYFFGIKENTNMTNGSTINPTFLLDAPVANASITQGWKLALSSREKVLSSPEVHNRAVYFSTYTSNVAATCVNPSGTARLYAVQMGNGDSAWDWSANTARSGENSGTRYRDIGSGIPSDPVTVQGSANDAIVVSTTDGQIATETRARAAAKRVRYWKEVF